MVECAYGCGQEAKHQLKNGKWCCSENSRFCPELAKKSARSRKGQKRTKEQRKRISKAHIGKKSTKKGKSYKEFYGNKKAEEIIEKMKKKKKWSLKKIKEKYSLMFIIEVFKEDGGILVHCKYNECKNSKENGGWFEPSYAQLYERHRALTNPSGFEENNFYCSEDCKQKCVLYGKRVCDLMGTNQDPYTYKEYQTFRTYVFERDNHTCQFCGKQAKHVHHERPKKLEPFFTLDPDLAWSCCKKCHYKKGHVKGTECSTGNLATMVCV